MVIRCLYSTRYNDYLNTIQILSSKNLFCWSQEDNQSFVLNSDVQTPLTKATIKNNLEHATEIITKAQAKQSAAVT